MATRSSTPKLRISPPLEAGASLLSAHQLSPGLREALEYVSSRLARKKLHLTLMVVRHEVTALSPLNPPCLALGASPAATAFPSSPIARIQTQSPLSDISSAVLSSQSHLSTSSNASRSRTRWPSLPTTPRDKLCAPPSPSPSPYRPVTPQVTLLSPAMPSLASPGCTSQAQNPYGITLLHASTLSAKATKTLESIMTRAEKKYPIGGGWLPTSILPSLSTQSATDTLIRRSLTQNTILFSSEGLTLLGLDSLYAVKSHLAAYTRSLSLRDLETAVDELHRLVLARHGTLVARGELASCYTELSISERAVCDIDTAYKTAYGGPHRRSGLDLSDDRPSSPTENRGRYHDVEGQQVVPSLDSTSCATAQHSLENKVEEKLTPVDVGESAKGKDSCLGWCDANASTPRAAPIAPAVTPGVWTQRTSALTRCGGDVSSVIGQEWTFLIGGNGCEIITCS